MNYRIACKPPHPGQLKVINWALEPSPAAKVGHLVCGRGYGKSVVAIMLAVMALSRGPKEVGLFIEPDWKRVRQVFLKKWMAMVPKQLYRLNKSECCIYWHNGARLYYMARDVTGNAGKSDDGTLGGDYTFIIDDEAALRCSEMFFNNTLPALRLPTPSLFYLMLTTPRLGPYTVLKSRKGHTVFNGTSYENIWTPRSVIDGWAKELSERQYQRDVLGMDVSLDGRVWDSWHDNENMSDKKFQRDKPYCLAGDIGVMSAWLIIQRYGNEDVIVGQSLFDDGGTKHDISRIVSKFGAPVKIICGGDLNTRSQVSGTTAAMEIKTALQSAGVPSSIPLVTPSMMDTAYADKGVQFQAMDTVIEKRRLKLSRWCTKEHGFLLGNEDRSFLKMIGQDTWPEPGKLVHWFTKDKSQNKSKAIEDVRDAALYYCVCEYPPRVSHKAA